MQRINKIKYSGPDNIQTETIHETIYTDDSHIFELEKQLHEQYAINNNSKSGTLISLIGSLLAIVSGYGYVLYEYRTGECNDLAIVYLAAFVAITAMSLLYCICVYLGSDQRMEQFVTFNIRIKYYREFGLSHYNEIYPTGYTPFGKTFFDFVQGIYNLLSKAILFIVFLESLCCWCMTKYHFSILIIGFICTIICVCYKVYRFGKYKKRELSERKKHESVLRNINVDKLPNKYCCCKIVCTAIVATFIVCFFTFLFVSSVCPKQTRYNESHFISLIIHKIK